MALFTWREGADTSKHFSLLFISKSLHNPQVHTNRQWQTEPSTSFNYFREETGFGLNDSKLLPASKTRLSSASH